MSPRTPFTGGLTINAGAVKASTSTASIGGATNVVTLNGATAALWKNINNLGSSTNSLAVGASGGTLASQGDFTLAMPVSLTGALTVSLADPALNSTDRSVTVTQAVTGGGSVVIGGNANYAAKTLTLSNASNTYSGDTAAGVRAG